MGSIDQFAIAAALAFALVPAHAEEAARPPRPAAEAAHACLNQRERRAEVETGRVIHLASAIHAIRSRIPGMVVRARLCRGHDGLAYVLTVLAHDGKVAKLTVDAVKGTLVGGL